MEWEGAEMRTSNKVIAKCGINITLPDRYTEEREAGLAKREASLSYVPL
jgi:hypothetical protein